MPTREHQGEITFLRRVIAYDNTVERHDLDQRITQAQRDALCVRRAVLVMGLLAAAAVAGLGYAAVFFPHHPLDPMRFFSHPLVKFLCALGLTALGCVLAFLALGAAYRSRLDERREECRRFATQLIESRLSRLPAGSTPAQVAGDPRRAITPEWSDASTGGTGPDVRARAGESR
jgi:hypothetical protein